MEKSRGSERSPSGLEDRLRQALEPRPEAVERIVRGALAGGCRPARRLRFATAVPVIAALALVAVLLAVRAERPRPEPAASISIESVGDMLIVRSPEGGPWVVRSEEPGGGSAPTGTLIVTYGGSR